MSTTYRPMPPGEPAPWFVTAGLQNPHYHFGSVAGRHVLLFFAGSLGNPAAAATLQQLLAQRAVFDDTRCSLFVLTMDRQDLATGRARDLVPGVRVLCDFDGRIGSQFGIATEPDASGAMTVRRSLLLLDPTLRAVRWWFGDAAAGEALPVLQGLPQPLTGAAQLQAPVIIVPNVFEPEFCRELIRFYEQTGGEDSGYMRNDPDGIRGVIDYSVKRRMDCTIPEGPLRRAIAARIQRRLKPEIERVFRFTATRMERYIVCCYDAEVGGYFRPHRDNDGDGHRQFAVTLNLNSEEYEGGDLRFPEYGLLTYRAPTGGACVFSCGLMHEATPVTRGRRYVFLPFLYDEAAAARREANNARYVDPKHHYQNSAG